MADRLTKEQGAILTAMTGVMCCGFNDFAEYATRKLGRQIWTHQYPALADEIKAAARPDFLAIMPEGTNLGR